MGTSNDLKLRDENIFPDDNVLSSVLGQAYDAYVEILDLFTKNELTHEWRYYKDGKAWLCKVQKKKKTIVWMSAWEGYFQAAIYIPLRLVDEILTLDISDVTKQNISNEKNVGNSKPCVFKIYKSSDLVDFEKVMQLKINSK
ncbi:MAG: DUF3788 domain-containing protein [Bacteroidia bacterium]|nr:DUF3788 domain-containing protein [Bacteroidia bacterium]NNK71036.1 DUF3788 family protein [Flavobacteriaceae bacterium]